MYGMYSNKFGLQHRGTIIKRANRYIAFRGKESTVAENKEYFPEKNNEYSNKYKTIFPHIKRTSKYYGTTHVEQKKRKKRVQSWIAQEWLNRFLIFFHTI